MRPLTRMVCFPSMWRTVGQRGSRHPQVASGGSWNLSTRAYGRLWCVCPRKHPSGGSQLHRQYWTELGKLFFDESRFANMRFFTLQKTGKEVLHLGEQRSSSTVWPLDYWKSNLGRWRLFTPGIDAYLNDALAGRSFGPSVDLFMLVLEVADFDAWGINGPFAGPKGNTSYSPIKRILQSVGRINWLDVQMLPPTEQLRAYRIAALTAIRQASQASRKPRDFAFSEFYDAIEEVLKRVKVSQVSRSAFEARTSPQPMTVKLTDVGL